MSKMVAKYRVIIRIGKVRYGALKDKRPLPWVRWQPESVEKPQLFTKDDASRIAEHYNDQKPEIEKLYFLKKIEAYEKA